MKIVLIIIAIIIFVVITIRLYISMHPVFGGKPVGSEMERIINSPNYVDGKFVNMEPTVVMANDSSMLSTMWEWIKGPENGKPNSIVTKSFNIDIFMLDADSSFKIIWLAIQVQ
ncbi:MAG: hypothetical protein HQ521_03890 [Bacteroidetes bacterium]|nr:hypothetical protein [Bacteroidota bacterium]